MQGQLTEREWEVLALLANGKTNPEIAKILFIELTTVKNHVARIYEKISARNRVEAAKFYYLSNMWSDENARENSSDRSGCFHRK